MNRKKNPRDVKGCPVTIRFTEDEVKMAKELREKYNVNISSLIRNAVREEYEKNKNM
jgi:hypothetical protein